MRLPIWAKDSFEIIDEDCVHICFVNNMANRDYIVHIVNNHKKLIEACEEFDRSFFKEGQMDMRKIGKARIKAQQALEENSQRNLSKPSRKRGKRND